MTFQSFFDRSKPTIREVAHVTGCMVSVFPAVAYGQLFYRQLEIDKIEALSKNGMNFDAHMNLSHLARQDLRWWIT